MSFYRPSLPDPIFRQVEKTLSMLLTVSVETEILPEADRWLWLELKQLLNRPQRFVEQPLLTLPDEPDAVLLLGLLVKKRTTTNSKIQTSLAKREAILTDWLQQQLTITYPERASTSSVLVFNYLIISQANVEWIAALFAKLAQKYPLNNWDPGCDLTLGSGTTGWLLMALNARRIYGSNLRIQSTISQIDAYLIPYIHYLHSHQIPVDSSAAFESLFPTSVTEFNWKLAEQQSWGQGDLGHLLLLYQAERFLGLPHLMNWTHRLGGFLIYLRQAGRMKLTNAGLLTGMAGVSLLYRQLYELSGQQRYYDEGIYWLQSTIEAIQQPDQQSDLTFSSGRLGVVCTLTRWLGHDVGLDLLHL